MLEPPDFAWKQIYILPTDDDDENDDNDDDDDDDDELGPFSSQAVQILHDIRSM